MAPEPVLSAFAPVSSPGMATLHLTGPVLIGPEEVRSEIWVVGGRVSFTPPMSGPVDTISGWVMPGLVDAHCHVGLGKEGAVTREVAQTQILRDRDAGTLLIRDAGSPADTRWVDERGDLPNVIRAGRHIARTRRYIRDYAQEVEPEDLVEVQDAPAEVERRLRAFGREALAPGAPRQAPADLDALRKGRDEARDRETDHAETLIGRPVGGAEEAEAALIDAGVDPIDERVALGASQGRGKVRAHLGVEVERVERRAIPIFEAAQHEARRLEARRLSHARRPAAA